MSRVIISPNQLTHLSGIAIKIGLTYEGGSKMLGQMSTFITEINHNLFNHKQIMKFKKNGYVFSIR